MGIFINNSENSTLTSSTITNPQSKRIIFLFLTIFFILLPVTRFFWDFVSENFLFIYVLCFLSVILYRQILSNSIIDLPRIHYSLLGFVICFIVSSLISPFKELVRNESITLFNTLSLFWIIQQLKTEIRISIQKMICGMAIVFFSLFIFAELSNTVAGYLKVEFFINKNLVASLNLLTLFIALNCYKNSRLLASITIVLAICIFFMTKSLSALTGAAAGLTYLFFIGTFEESDAGSLEAKHLLTISDDKNGLWSTLKIKWNTFHFKFLLFIILITAALFIFSIENWTKHSALDRMRWWVVAIRILFDHPLWGSGPGSFEKIFQVYSSLGLKSIYAHNYFLQTASEIGILATLFLIVFFFYQIKNSSQRFLTAGLIAILIQNLFDFSLHIPGFFMLFWIVLSLATPEKFAHFDSIKLFKTQFDIKKFLSWPFFGIMSILIISAGWRWGIKPLIAFQESLNAQTSFQKMDLLKTEQHLRNAIRWDSLPPSYYSNLSFILSLRYQNDSTNAYLLEESIALQKEALRKEPTSQFYKDRLTELSK